MNKSNEAFITLSVLSSLFALASLWIAFIVALLFWQSDNSSTTWDAIQYSIYYVANAILALFVGILAGFDIKKRFYVPIIMATCLVPTVLLFRYYTAFWDWFCIVTTLVVGVVAMFVSSALTRKKATKSSEIIVLADQQKLN